MAMQTVREYGVQPPLEGPSSLVESVAWWLLTGVGQPDREDLFVYGGEGSIQQRQEVAAQVQRLLDESEAVGIRPALEEILKRLTQV